MEIYGFQKTTLLDYPEHVAATVFTGGCNFRCPFCHNGVLVREPREELPRIPEEEVLAYLKKRRGILEGVCVTGGEPTLQSNLAEFLGRVKEMGYLVKLDTNGSRPEVLRSLMDAGLLNYVAMDIKASWDNYAKAAGVPRLNLAPIRESIELLGSGRVAYEFRTTVVKGIHTLQEFDQIGQMIEGCPAYYLQCFRESEDMLGEGFEAFSKEEMEKMAALAGEHLGRVSLRGIE